MAIDGLRGTQSLLRFFMRQWWENDNVAVVRRVQLRYNVIPATKNPFRIKGLLLREQDSNLQPCGYGMLPCFRIGPDYLIIL